MITVTVHKEGDTYLSFQSKGHAGSGREGRDIVCAAVSVLVINTVNSLEQLTSDRVRVQSEDGFVRMDFQEPLSDEGRLLMDSLMLGLSSVAGSTGKRYLQINVREV